MYKIKIPDNIVCEQPKDDVKIITTKSRVVYKDYTNGKVFDKKFNRFLK